MILLLFLTAFFQEKLTVGNAEPVEPQAIKIRDTQIWYQSDRWKGRIRALSADELIAFIHDMGISPAVLERPGVREMFSTRILAFVIRFDNLGTETLAFNPDQMTLTSRRGVEGIVMDMARLWPTTVPQGDKDLERLAKIFSRRSSDVPPGERRTQLMVFHASKQRFGKRVTLRLDRLYYGTETFHIECRFEIGYGQ